MHESFYNKFGSDIMLSNVFKTGLIKLNEQRFSRKTIKEKTLINLEQFQSISKMSEFQPTRKFYFLNVLLENRTLNTGPRQIKLLPLLERRRNKTVISMSGFWATWIQRYQSVAIFFVFLSSIYLQIYRNIQIFLRCHKIFQTNASIQGPITNEWKLPRCVWAFNSDHQSGKSSLSHFYKSPVQLKFHEF